MAPAAPNSSTINLKLLIDLKSQKVLFAEAGKDFVDFLFTLLSLPVGTVTRLLSEHGMVGSFGKLYRGVENLSDTYMQPYLDKDILLNPKTQVAGPNVLGLLESPPTNKLFYMCSKNYSIPSSHGPASHRYVTEDPKELCPSCKSAMSSEATYVSQPKATTEASSGAGAAGYVKDKVTYMIMDDLEVKPPMSTISSITLLNSFSIKDISALEVKVVELGVDEGVKLLKESLNSNSVLTNVFLGKKAAAVAVMSQVVHFRSFDKPKEDDFSLELSKLHTYDDVVERVAEQLGLDDPSKIRLTSHNCYSKQPKPQPIKYRGVERLTDMLVHYNQTSDILYYEVLDIPLPELQGLKALNVAFHHATKDEVVIHTIRLPKQSTVEDVIKDLKTKVELSHPDAELRLLEVFCHKIFKVFPQSEKIENINEQFWTLRAEEVPEEEKNLGPNDRAIHVYHFIKDTAQNQKQIQNFGEPFFLVIHEGETLAEIRVRIQKKLQVADEEFAKWKFAFISLGRPEYLQDSDVVSSRFQRRDVYGAWEQYLGLEHDSTPNRAYAANQNRLPFKKPVKINN